MTMPTDKHKELTASLEYSLILCAKAIKKQHIAVPEHKQKKAKDHGGFHLCIFNSDTTDFLLWYAWILRPRGISRQPKKRPKYAPGYSVKSHLFPHLIQVREWQMPFIHVDMQFIVYLNNIILGKADLIPWFSSMPVPYFRHPFHYCLQTPIYCHVGVVLHMQYLAQQWNQWSPLQILKLVDEKKWIKFA